MVTLVKGSVHRISTRRVVERRDAWIKPEYPEGFIPRLFIILKFHYCWSDGSAIPAYHADNGYGRDRAGIDVNSYHPAQNKGILFEAFEPGAAGWNLAVGDTENRVEGPQNSIN